MGKKHPAVYLLFFIVAGIITADQTRIDALYFFGVLVIALLAGLYLFYKRSKLALLFIGLTFFGFSSFSFALKYYTITNNHISNFTKSGEEFEFFGEITDYPDLKLDQTEIKVELDSLVKNHKAYSVDGSILLIITDTTTYFQRSDRIIFSGKLYPVEGSSFSKEFDYSRYLRNHGISGRVYHPTIHDIKIVRSGASLIGNYIDYLRDWIRETLQKNLSKNSAALALGFLIGETRNIPTDVYRNFKNSGTLHLLAVSGSNVALVVLFFIIVLMPFQVSRIKRNLLLILVVAVFTILAYGEPSVVRASLMAFLVLTASCLSRKIDLNQIIALAAVIILLLDPAQIFDIGFQLSFVIAWGLIFSVPKITDKFSRYQNSLWYRYLLFPFLVSLTAQVFSIGLIGLYFQQIPIISPVANLFIVPLVSAVVVGVLILLVAAFILPFLGMLVGTFLNLLIEFTLYLVNQFGSESIPRIIVDDWSILSVVVGYFVLFIMAASLTSKKALRFGIVLILIVINVGAVDALIGKLNETGEIILTSATLPGGVMTVIKEKGSNNGDLVITSSEHKDYSISEKIIYPFLVKSKVDEIGNLFVLSSDFDGWKDLLLMDTLINIKKYYIPGKFKPQIKDIISFNRLEALLNKVVFYESDRIEEMGSGFNLFEDIIQIEISGLSVLISPDISKKIISKLNSADYLIVGEKINLNESNCNYLLKSNQVKLICSKIEQKDDFIRNSPYKERLLDLYSERAVSITAKLPNR